MALREKANQFLLKLNEFATSEGYGSYADANKICEKLKIIDRAEVRQIVKLLENRGLVRVIWTSRDISVNISEEGVIFIESGN